jgi:hypothetical protein
MNDSYFDLTFGLITKNDRESENGGLFLSEYLVLLKMLNNTNYLSGYVYTIKMGRARVKNGLYLRSRNHPNRTVSHDEITGMIASSHILKTPHKHNIIKYLIKHFGNYPATGKNKFYNPADFYAWFELTGNKLKYLFLPFYTINLLITSNKTAQDTSGKLIYMTELFLMKDISLYSKLLWKYFDWRMKLMYSEKWVKDLVDIYFHTEDLDHPIRFLANKL